MIRTASRHSSTYRGLLLVTLAITAGCRRAEVGEGLPVAVKVMRVAREELASELRYSGSVRELQKVDLSFKVAGTVQELLQVKGPDGTPHDVQAGDCVPSGQAIARLDEGDYQRKWNIAHEQLSQAENKHKAAVADADVAMKEAARFQMLFLQKATSQSEYDAAASRRDATQATVGAAEREVQAARIAQQQAQDDLEHCTLGVPEMGRALVAEKYVEKNERVAPNQRAFLLIDVAKVRVFFGAPDSQVGNLAMGQPIPVVAEALGDKNFTGRVTKIAAMADLGTRTFPIELTIDEPAGLRPGMIVTVLLGDKKNGVLLPMTAVQRGDTKQEFVVFAVGDEDGKKTVRRRRVELGGIYDNRIQVLPGPSTQLQEGDVIVTNGASRLVDGQAVRLLGGGT